MTIGSFKAKTHFSEIIEDVQKGLDFIITKRGKPVAILKPYQKSRPSRRETTRKIRGLALMDGKTLNIRDLIDKGRAG